MFNILLILVGILLVMTVGAALQCYKTLRNAQKEYEKAKDAVEDIVLSFNRQLNHEAGKSERLALKVEAISSKIGGTLKKSEEGEKSLQALESRIASALEDRDRTLSRLEEVEKKTCDAISSQAT